MDPKQLRKEQLQKRIETLAEKQMKSSLHARFLQNCIESECVPEGMLLKKKIYVGKNFSELQKSVDDLLKKVSLDICDKVCSAHQQKVREIGTEMESLRDVLKSKSDDEYISEFDQKIFEKTEKKKNSILEKQNKKLQHLQAKDKNQPEDTLNTESERPSSKQTQKKRKRQNKKGKSKPKNKATYQENATKCTETNNTRSNQTGVKITNKQTKNHPKPRSEQPSSNQPKNSPTPGTKKTYAEATKKGLEMNMHETLVNLLSTVKTLLEKNQPIIPGGGTDDSSVNPTKTNGGRRRKENKRFGEGKKQ